MEALKKFLIVTIGKLEKVDYALVIILWTVGTILAVTGMPWINFAIILMHICEVPIGFTVGRKYGVKFPELVVMHFAFGFTWWVPLIYKNEYQK